MGQVIEMGRKNKRIEEQPDKLPVKDIMRANPHWRPRKYGRRMYIPDEDVSNQSDTRRDNAEQYRGIQGKANCKPSNIIKKEGASLKNGTQK